MILESTTGSPSARQFDAELFVFSVAVERAGGRFENVRRRDAA